MKTTYLLKTWILILSFSAIQSQDMDALVIHLNKEMAPNIKFKAKEDRGIVTLSRKNFDLDLSRKTPDSIFNRPSKLKNGKYIGPIFWRFNFPGIAQNGAVFELDSLGQLQLRIHLQVPDTILIKSKLNAFSSHHHIYNSRLHYVSWTGKKSLLLKLKIARKEEQLHFSLLQIKLGGTFNRTDRFKLSPRYVKALEQRFEKAVNKFLETEQTDVLFTLKDPQ